MLPGGDVVLQVLDLEALLLRLELDEVADRDHADEGAAVGDGRVADAAVGHQRHALLDARVGRDADDGSGHDLADGGGARAPPFDGDPAQVVPLGEDADDLVAVGDEERSHVRLDHRLDGVEHGGVRADPDHVAGLPLEDVGDRLHRGTGRVMPPS